MIADETSIPILKNVGIDYINLHSDWRNLLTEVETVKIILSKEKNPVLFIDTYQVTKQYIKELKPLCKIAYLGSKKEYLGDLDVLINYSADIDYNFYSDNYGNQTRLLLGVAYAPLRNEFQTAKHVYRNKISRILLTTGNTNKDGVSQRIICKLMSVIKDDDIIIDVVVGRLYKDKKEIQELFKCNHNVCLHNNVKSMSDLMEKCDLAISANGTTVYELSVLGIPTISFAMVSEQVKSAEALSGLGALDYSGRYYQDPEGCIDTIVSKVLNYLEHNNELIALGQRAHQLIDGKGCQRIVDSLL